MRLWVSVLLLGLVVSCLEAEDEYMITGRLLIDEEGVAHIYLVDAEQFSEPFTGVEEIVTDISPGQLATGFVPFSFLNIPGGEYGIRVFVDTNGNGKLDRGLLGPSEPWGMSWRGERTSRIPRFRDIAFRLAGDMHGLEIDTRKDQKPLP
jgi:hypothetical protein